MSELAKRSESNLEPRRGPGRPLGVRLKPALRLSIGEPKPDGGIGKPIDHFRAKWGAQNEHRAAAEKFHRIYGEKPSAIDILLPVSLAQAIEIRHKAFGGGGGDEGGVLKAIGQTNFALEGTLGGADVLTILAATGDEEIEITGVDDPAAKKFGVELVTTLRFQIPSVLGFGQYAEIQSKGKNTTDALWQRLVMLYELFGARTSFVVRPKLIVKPDTGRPIITDKRTGEVKRIKSSFYSLDLYMPESQDEMVERLRKFNASLSGESLYENGGAASALPESTSAGQPSPSPVDAEVTADAAPSPRGAPAAASTEEEALEGTVVDEEWPPEPEEPPAQSQFVAPTASDPAVWDRVVVPKGKHAGKTIAEIGSVDPAYVREYLSAKIEAGEVKRAAVAWTRAHPA